ncbi:hypothetical protein N8T08_001730 [Aspergillus melleus]|uniref:Uncharacterized protein n=1 Tax=Aspergillus melleus TaxID=138277 RepID=A0ACC3AN15_9EURO|nr:hypothetical protein N8T08_001730 [Aspergillus melleus]
MPLRTLLPCVLLHLLLFSTSTSARRGGGDGEGDSDGDGSDSSNDDGGSSTSTNEHCGSRFQNLEAIDLIPDNVRNWTSSDAGGRRGRNPTTYDCSSFYDEATMSLMFRGNPQCHIDEVVHLLSYAWVGAQTPYPEGPTNPFMIALNAWKSNVKINMGDGG